MYGKPPATIYATLLDEGTYLGSVRTMYRLLNTDGQSRERRHQLTHRAYAKPELLATGPNAVWSWDITKLRGTGQMVLLPSLCDPRHLQPLCCRLDDRPSRKRRTAEQLIADTIAKQVIEPGTLTLHADRGTGMRSKVVAQLLVDLEVAKSHSRPFVSDDNPFSESNFKTLKDRPEFPDRFGCIEDARAHCRQFFGWYNDCHRHSGIGWMTPQAVHHGQAKALFKQRAVTLDAAFVAHPNRFKGNCPQPPKLPIAAWINPPKRTTDHATDTSTLN
jgi:putative transposase